jgi:hypothetical protein
MSILQALRPSQPEIASSAAPRGKGRQRTAVEASPARIVVRLASRPGCDTRRVSPARSWRAPAASRAQRPPAAKIQDLGSDVDLQGADAVPPLPRLAEPIRCEREERFRILKGDLRRGIGSRGREPPQLVEKIAGRLPAQDLERERRADEGQTIRSFEILRERGVELRDTPGPVASAQGGQDRIGQHQRDAFPVAQPPNERETRAGGLEARSRVKISLQGGAVVVSATSHRCDVERLGELRAGPNEGDALDHPAEVGECRSLRDERVGQDRAEVCMLGGREDPIGGLERALRVRRPGEEVAPGELAIEGDDGGVSREVCELGGGRLEGGEGGGVAEVADEHSAQRGGRPGDGRPIAELAADLERRPEVPLGGLVPTGVLGFSPARSGAAPGRPWS